MIDDQLGDSFGVCPCGSAWFELANPADAESDELGPAVCIDLEGNVTGYAAMLICVQCGLDWYPARLETGPSHLRLVE